MELNAETKAVRDDLMAAITEFKTGARADIDALKTAVANAETKEQFASLKTQVEGLRAELQRPGAGGRTSSQKTAGQLFVESDELKVFLARGYHKGGAAIKLPSDLLHQWEHKTTITSTAVGSSTSGILVPERVQSIIKPPLRRVRVRALIPFGTTTANAIEFVKENVFTNAASPQTEASDKPESALTFTIASALVRTIAHWIPATRQVLDDFVQLQAYIDQRLLDGLADIEDYELLRGDGTGVHISGLIPAATAYAGTYAVAGDTKIDVINNAITELEDNNYVADGVVVHPSDWRKMQKIKTEEGGANKGMYVLGGPAQTPERMIWDLNVATTTAMPKGYFLVGQFQGSVQGWDRQEATVDISTEHSDYFVKNLVAIRAEKRETIAIYRPGAFRYGAF